ncbi:asparaginase [uncultured Veillonella sp.]|uniref:asparaginase n=1 Tax=uncultured Veillonella sp. TaxID=159268 RepID=UPI00258F1BA4|nr:asparaginase [uncultured Veillonella sp.]
MTYDKKVIIIGTGGTIAGRSGAAEDLTGYHAGELSVESLLSSVPGLMHYGPFECEQFSNIDSSDITVEHWVRLAATVQRYVDDDTVAGIVITHGTDSMEETAYFLHLTVDTDKPVVLTGSMRPATAISADGPLNLLMAVQTVRAEASRGKGIIVALNGYLDCAREVTKLHTTDVATFGNDYFGHMGLVQDGIPFYYYEPLRRHTKHSEFARLGEQTLPQVEILYLYGGIEENFVAAALSQRLDGLVVAGLGHGIIPQRIESQLSSLTIPIVRASKTGHGMVSPMKNDSLHGMVAADTLTPVKARILLMLGLTKTRHVDELQSMFGTY